MDTPVGDQLQAAQQIAEYVRDLMKSLEPFCDNPAYQQVMGLLYASGPDLEVAAIGCEKEANGVIEFCQGEGIILSEEIHTARSLWHVLHMTAASARALYKTGSEQKRWAGIASSAFILAQRELATAGAVGHRAKIAERISGGGTHGHHVSINNN